MILINLNFSIWARFCGIIGSIGPDQLAVIPLDEFNVPIWIAIVTTVAAAVVLGKPLSA